MMKKKSSLERKMLSYFGLIAAASLLITVEFIYAIQVVTPEPEIIAACSLPSNSPAHDLIPRLKGLRDKAFLMCAVQGIVTLIVLIMFMRRITGPLQHMVETSQLISEGDLSRTIRVRSADEIGALGETINGLTSNIQEIVAYGLSTQASLRELSDHLKTTLESRKEADEVLNQIDITLAGFEDMMNSFKLFPDPLADPEGEKD